MLFPFQHHHNTSLSCCFYCIYLSASLASCPSLSFSFAGSPRRSTRLLGLMPLRASFSFILHHHNTPRCCCPSCIYLFKPFSFISFPCFLSARSLGHSTWLLELVLQRSASIIFLHHISTLAFSHFPSLSCFPFRCLCLSLCFISFDPFVSAD